VVWITGVDVDPARDPTTWPWTVPSMAAIERLDLGRPVTFLCGENGSGKSTIVESIAQACGCPGTGGAANRWFAGPTAGVASLLRPRWSDRKPASAWFLRAETFHDLAAAAEATDDVPRTGAVDYEAAQLLADFDGESPLERSHGQGFLGLFTSRMHGQSLWFMDEPEAALSLRSCLGLLATISELVDIGAQLVIATHSPVLLAYPDATIYELDDDGFTRRSWEETTVVQDTRAFLDAPERFFRHLF
jgi:predicted ATPase